MTIVASKPNYSQITQPFNVIKHTLESSYNKLQVAKNFTQNESVYLKLWLNESSLKAHLSQPKHPPVNSNPAPYATLLAIISRT